KDGTLFVMIRRELEDKMGVMAKSVAHYTDWTYTKMKFRLGGPNFLFDKKQRIIPTTRLYEPEAYTGLLVGDNAADLKEVLHLPSGGDNSYAGMVIHKRNLWLSYYSSHEGKTAIYIAKVPLSYLKKQAIE